MQTAPELFTNGIAPGSPHTIAPVRAARHDTGAGGLAVSGAEC